MILAQLAMPFPLHPTIPQPALERAAAGEITLFSAPAGYLFTNHLSGLLQSRHAHIIWLRIAPEDRDPASLLLALIAGAEQIYPRSGERAMQMLRQQPGDLYGWAPLFTALAQDIAQASCSASGGADCPLALVLQHIDSLSAAPKTLDLLWQHFLPLLPPRSIRILTSHGPLPRTNLPPYIQQCGPRDLRLDEHTALLLAQGMAGSRQPSLPVAALRRMVALAQGRGLAIEGLLSVGRSLGDDVVRRAIEESVSAGELLGRVARRCLDTIQPRGVSLLALAIKLPYLNPAMIQAVLGPVPELPVALMQPLEDEWARLNCVWQNPLRAALRPGEVHDRDLMESAAQYLVHQGAVDQAIPLLMELNQHQEAARLLVKVVEPMIDRGQWETLSGWLTRLPEPVRRSWPWLVYAEGELAAARGQTRGARKLFAVSTRLFYEHCDYVGACQSLLTESALSDRDQDSALSQQYAQEAQSLAQKAGLPWQQGWAGWQLGRLAAVEGNLEAALSQFDRASRSAEMIQDAHMAEFIDQARSLIQQRIELRREKEQHQRELQAAKQREEAITAQLNGLLSNPADLAGGLLNRYGWSLAPMFLKLPQPDDPQPIPERLVALLLDFLRPHTALRSDAPAAGISPAAAAPVNPKPEPVIPTTEVLPVTGVPLQKKLSDPAPAGLASAALVPDLPFGKNDLKLDGESAPPEITYNIEMSSAEPFLPELPIARDLPFPPAIIPSPYEDPVTGPLSAGNLPVLNAYLLGSFRVILNDAAIESWPSGRARGLFAFLLTQHNHPVPREVIMETFWPEASAESARNSLNVAVHSLRQALKASLDQPLILFHENAYHINPDLTIWLDVDSYEHHAQAGRKAETAGLLATAVHQYEMAISLYQGDLLAENLYDDWPVVERERLRVLYMETLDRLSMIYYNHSQYTACASLCQRMLMHDACREDAHCRLMVCYSRQGQNHMALRQYQACVESLRRDLDVSPSPDTVKLYEQIKRRDAV